MVTKSDMFNQSIILINQSINQSIFIPPKIKRHLKLHILLEGNVKYINIRKIKNCSGIPPYFHVVFISNFFGPSKGLYNILEKPLVNMVTR